MSKDFNLNRRRAFLKNGFKMVTGSVLFSGYLSSCDESFYKTILIDEGLCIGCNDCNNVCNYDAIIKNGTSYYAITSKSCTSCGWCVDVCDDDAINMAVKSYKIKSSDCTGCNDCLPSCNYGALKIASNNYTIKSGCVGCGDCIPVCDNEGKAIEYEVSEYSVKGGWCHGCVSRCSGACRYGAISRKNGRAHIDTSKCTRCGDCLKACPHSAIKKAYVSINQEKCTQCGKCYDACTYKQIEKSGTADIAESYIEKESCNNCGECINTCPEDAIYVEQQGYAEPHINNNLCTGCGDCFDICKVHTAVTRSTSTVSINQSNCMKCDKCSDVCKYNAVITT